jgi:hypothetical protein
MLLDGAIFEREFEGLAQMTQHGGGIQPAPKRRLPFLHMRESTEYLFNVGDGIQAFQLSKCCQRGGILHSVYYETIFF